MNLPHDHFHTSLRPKDKDGIELRPLDLVIIREIPSHYYNDPDCVALANYKGCYGLISYFQGEPFFYNNKNNAGWVSADGSEVYVLTHRISEDSVCSFDLWIPTVNLIKIPYNMPIMSIFSEYPWQMRDDNGPSSHNFVLRGMEQFRQIELILKTPYEQLMRAHTAAIKVIMSVSKEN